MVQYYRVRNERDFFDMILLNGSNLEKIFSGEVLFNNVSFNIGDSDKIGFVGVNGAGKSTLFKIIAGDLEPDSGEIFKNRDLTIGCLDQYALSGSGLSIWDEIATAFSDVIELEKQLDILRFDIENKNGNIDMLVNRQVSLQEKFSAMGGFYYKSKIRSTLLGLGFSEEEFDLKVSNLSGGQKTRVSLGKLLLGNAKLLLLDEPTNHLDIDSVEWLEEFLRGYNGAFVVISHDRYFLDRVTSKTFELRSGRLRTYNGSYSKYIKQSELERLSEERSYENTKKEIERLEGIVEQQRRWNREKNIKTAESKMKAIEKLEKDLIAPDSKREVMDFKFETVQGGGQDVLITNGLSKSFGGESVFKNADVFVKKGERVFLTGPNGCGKTTFLKIVLGMYEPTSGTAQIGANIETGYYDQLQENLSPQKTVLDEIYDEYPDMTLTEIRNALAVFMFRGEDVFKKIEALSGGERARVELAKLMLKKNNFLIMDEPTNHLDIDSREALEKALMGYDATMLMVSHDRYFINKLADRILYMTPDGIISFVGNYDEFLEKRKTEQKESTQKSDSVSKLDYMERKRAEAQKRKIINRFKNVEREISATEDSISECEKRLGDSDVATDYIKLGELSDELSALNEKLDTLYSEWEELQTEIEESGYEI